MLEPYEMKESCTVLTGGKFVKIYLSDQQANHSLETLSTEWFGTSMLGAICWCKGRVRYCCKATVFVSCNL